MKPLPTLAQIGQRVSLRLHDPEGGFRDLLGHLVAVNQVRKKDGQIVTFDPDRISLWKVVPSNPIFTGIFLYDTMSRTQRELTISDGKALRMYCCGPTVYRDAHVGNLRTFLLGDLIMRLVRLDGHRVRSVQNITDVGHMSEVSKELTDILFGTQSWRNGVPPIEPKPNKEELEDKILSQAKAERRDPFDVARSYEAGFHQDIARLAISTSDIYPRASESIELMHRLIEKLIDSDHAYIGGDGSVYFSAGSFESYGTLSGNKLTELIPGHRYEYEEEDDTKRFHADWALWKAAGSRSEMVWDSPWGRGFPGWHIECSAMSLHYLDNHVDLHLGGIDLRFPHHENERAQSNCASSSEVTDHWVHGEHLLFEGRKMSKSSGNVVLLDDVIRRGFDPLALRLVFLENKYRSQMDLTWDLISAADSTIARWRNKYQEWSKSEAHNDPEAVAAIIDSIYTLLRADLDTPRALVKMRTLERDPSISDSCKAQVFAEADKFFGLDVTRTYIELELTPEIQLLITLRAQAREAKDFARSDELRDDLATKKIKVIDGPNGQSWEVIP